MRHTNEMDQSKLIMIQTLLNENDLTFKFKILIIDRQKSVLYAFITVLLTCMIHEYYYTILQSTAYYTTL